MQDPATFLRHVLPPLRSGEWYVHAVPKGKGFYQTACASIEALCAKSDEATAHHASSYFTLASTVQPNAPMNDSVCFGGKSVSRKKEVIKALQSVWVDLDCGAEKDYPSQNAAYAALQGFIQQTKLLPTYVVNSGHGVHVYWTFNQPYFLSDTDAIAYFSDFLPTLNEPDWQTMKQQNMLWLRDELAANFYAICRHFGLKIDAAATDATRVLRVPGSWNWKNEAHPVPCILLIDNGPVWKQSEFDHICVKLIADNAVQVRHRKASTAAPKDMSFAAQELSKFTNDDEKIKGLDNIIEQCAQIRTMGLASEPVWYLGIKLCLHCEGGVDTIHRLSAEDTVRYTPENTDAYINRNTPAAITCQRFAEYRLEVCEQCPHYGRITTPLQLANMVSIQKQIDQAPALHIPEHLEYPPYEPDPVPYVSQGSTDFFCDEYGVWLKQVDDNRQPVTPLHVTNSVIEYLFSTVSIKGKAQSVDVFKVYTVGAKEASVREFPTRYLGDIKRICEWCGDNRLIAFTEQKVLASFINAYVKQQISNRSVNLRPQVSEYGWREDTNGQLQFVVDDYVITNHGAEPLGYVSRDQVGPFTRKGSLDEWKKVPQLYKDLDQPLGQLAMCMALAAPLMHYGIGEAKNCVMNIFSVAGGKGKSHLLKACASIYGNPARAFLQNQASATATQKYIARSRNMPVFMDEIGNKDDKQLADLVYVMVNGVEMQKLNRDSSIRQTGLWNTTIMTTANKPLKDVMALQYANTDAGVLRVIDCECDFIAPAPGSPEFYHIGESFAILENNYGLAGPEFIYQILRDPARLTTIAPLANAFVVKNNFKSNERFYSFPFAIGLTAGRWAVEFGIFNFDMQELEDYVLNYLMPILRDNDRASGPDYENDLNEFINDNLKLNCLIVKGESRKPNETTTVTASGVIDSYVNSYPRMALYMRYELDTHVVYISSKAFTEWCKREHKSFRVMLTVLRKLQIVLPGTDIKYNLGKCVPRYNVSRVRCIVLNPDYVRKNITVDDTKPAVVPESQLSAEELDQLRTLQNSAQANVVGTMQNVTEEKVDGILKDLGL